MIISSKTDKGIIRSNNEDSLLVIAPWHELAVRNGACLFVVADGMGGQNAGEVASELAVSVAKEWFENTKITEITPKLMGELVEVVNEKVWAYAQANPETKGMGTTFSAILFKDNKAVICHIGDSRIIRVRDNILLQLTNDHSIVGEQVRLGRITPEQARVSPIRNILSKVLGARQFISPDIFETEIKVNDKFVLCTDGLYSMLECSFFEKLIKETKVEELADLLIQQANLNGGKDNSTVIALQITEFPIKIPST